MDIQLINIKNDIDELTTLFINVYSKPPWNDNWELKDQAKEYLLQITKMPDYLGYCIKIDNKIIGASFGYIKKWYRGNEYYIHEFYVDSENQRTGFGSKLLNFIEDELKKRKVYSITLLTNKNLPSFIFYAKNRFKPIEDLYFMHLKLKA